MLSIFWKYKKSAELIMKHHKQKKCEINYWMEGV